MFRRLFRHQRFDWGKINYALLLGFGTGSIVKIIREYCKECRIDGVEIDDKIIELGRKYFRTEELHNVNIYCDSAENFIAKTGKKYDLIIIDIYIDLHVPEEVETGQFLSLVKSALNTGGQVVFNKFVNSKESRKQLSLLKERYEKIFGNVKIMTVMTTGKIFVAGKRMNSD